MASGRNGGDIDRSEIGGAAGSAANAGAALDERLAVARRIRDVAADESLSPGTRARRAARHAIEAARRSAGPSFAGRFDQQLRNLETAEDLLKAFDPDQKDFATSVDVAKIATRWQAEAFGVNLSAVEHQSAQHDSPSAAIATLVEHLGGSLTEAEAGEAEGLDDLQSPLRESLTAVIDGFTAFSVATETAYAGADQSRLNELTDRLQAGEREAVYQEEGIQSPADLAEVIGLDFGPVFAARNALLDAVAEFVAAVGDSPSMQQQAAAPISFAPYYSIELGTATNNTYTQDFALLIDAGGADAYWNNAGGANSLRLMPTAALIDVLGNDVYYGRSGGGTTGGGWAGSGFLVDSLGIDVFQPYADQSGHTGGGFLGTGFLMKHLSGSGAAYTLRGVNNNGQSALWGAHGGGYGGAGMLIDSFGTAHVTGASSRSYASYGTNGGATVAGVGFLFNGVSNATYVGGSGGTNGGADLGGVGFLMNSVGHNQVYGGNNGTNGGATLGGVGFLYDDMGDDRLDAWSLGTNGGGTTGGVGTVVNAGTLGNGTTYVAGSQGTNGGGGQGSDLVGIVGGFGFLIDGVGNDVYSAGSEGSNGGGSVGTGFLADLGGHDRYYASSGGVNGGGSAGVGLLIDSMGYDTYSDSEGGSGANRSVIPKGLVGAQVDSDTASPVPTTVPTLPPTTAPPLPPTTLPPLPSTSTTVPGMPPTTLPPTPGPVSDVEWLVGDARATVDELVPVEGGATGSGVGGNYDVATIYFDREHQAAFAKLDHLSQGNWGSGARVQITCFGESIKRGIVTEFQTKRWLMTGINHSAGDGQGCTQRNNAVSILRWDDQWFLTTVAVPDQNAGQNYSHWKNGNDGWCSSVPWNPWLECYFDLPGGVPLGQRFISGLAGENGGGMVHQGARLDHAPQSDAAWQTPSGTWLVGNPTGSIRHGHAGGHTIRNVDDWPNGLDYCYRAEDKGEAPPGSCH